VKNIRRYFLLTLEVLWYDSHELYLRGNKNIPLGFFDDSLKEAKVKEVNIEEVSQKQMEKDWEAFQEFVAEVEEDTQKEQILQQEESKEKDALEKLENMEYLDRYRQVLEVVTKKRPINEVTKDQTNNLLDTVTQQLKKKSKALAEKEEDDSDDDEFDPCNWRSKKL
jgi:hypothetical protein